MNTKIEEREPEIWVDINNYNGAYQISSHGMVYSTDYRKTGKKQLLIQGEDKDGYLCVSLCKNGKSKTLKVHRLVGIYFIDNPNSLPEINHKCGDKKNNYYKDLEWSTRPDNIRHSYETGLKPKTTEKQRKSVIATNELKKKIVYQYDLNKCLIDEYLGLVAATNATKVDMGNISSCCLGKVKTAGGFIWSYSKI